MFVSGLAEVEEDAVTLRVDRAVLLDDPGVEVVDRVVGDLFADLLQEVDGRLGLADGLKRWL